ncbi:ArnT family glycosyltransferase [Amycolatopsis sp. H20-H5]|uniref:ArnT family glycosyltransferase n=1 Tax=Amycolatopsis sp. H20-H5 TaxID=3046309 RepID=UPI002DBA204B|nr:glycosyltransferase family 39 protein [Amycolatopsis sp. H20-H5]MEC3974161.1 glycosyltransferase family 39 protein [Amycolatopsis sp. H20-H5]
MSEERLPSFALRPVGAVVLAQVAVLAAFSGRYGFFRDELYFLAAGKHPAWGYVDQPPLTPLLARASSALFGETPTGLRIVAILMAAATVVVVSLVARELGGGRGPQVLSAAATALSGFGLVVSHLLSTSTFDLLVWVTLGLLTLRLLRTGDGRWWLPIGAVIGIGLANKWLVLLLVAALGLALLVTGPRSVLTSLWLLVAVPLAAVLAAPVLMWQASENFPMLSVASGIAASDGTENRIMFVPLQLVYVAPVLVPVWIAGLVRLWREPALRWARALALTYPIVCVALLLLGGKPYYAAPLLLLLTAAGAEPSLRWLDRGRRRVGWTIAAVVGAGISLVIGLPILPPSALAPVTAVNNDAGEQVGWPKFVQTVAGVWQQIPPGQRATAVILTGNYGQAGAVELYGPGIGLPKPYSGHMSYADWGPPPDSLTGPVVLVGRFENDDPARRFLVGCHDVAVHDNGLGLDNDEQGTKIALCAGTSGHWSRFWPQLRRYYS